MAIVSGVGTIDNRINDVQPFVHVFAAVVREVVCLAAVADDVVLARVESDAEVVAGFAAVDFFELFHVLPEQDADGGLGHGGFIPGDVLIGDDEPPGCACTMVS